MNILLTGAAGQLGQALRQLMEAVAWARPLS
jgi:dTDP-4-dehydrorhamnose reductase